MNITFDGRNIHDLITQMQSLIAFFNTREVGGPLPPTPAPPAEEAQGPGPQGSPFEEPALNKPVDKPVGKPVDKPSTAAKPKIDRVAAMNKARAAKVAKAAAAKVPEPEPEPVEEEPVDPAEVVRIRQKTIEDLQAAYANGHQKEVFELLSRFGNGAKSFRELPPDAFMPIRKAIDNGALKGQKLMSRARGVLSLVGCDVAGVPRERHLDEGRYPSFVRYAREGTAAHRVAEMTLNGDIFLPDKVTVEGDEYIVTPGMCRALNPYVTHVQALRALPGAAAGAGKAPRRARHRRHGLGHARLRRSHRVRHPHRRSQIRQGRRRRPESPQLKFYALAFASFMGMSMNRRRSKVYLTICQPRIEGQPLRTHDDDAGGSGGLARNRGEARAGPHRGERPDRSRGAHCRWCVRKTECTAFAGKHQTHAAAAFDDEGLFM